MKITQHSGTTPAKHQTFAAATRKFQGLCRQILAEGAASAAPKEGARISLAQVPGLAQRHFPLCMQHLYATLQTDRHLRHAGRLQLGLFLKKAGLSLDESMAFWKAGFAPRTTGEKFEKEYAYNVRHSYGREGRRKDYEAHNCLKIISASPGVGEAHGCPFKALGGDALRAMLSRAGVPSQCAPPALLFCVSTLPSTATLLPCGHVCNKRAL